MIIFWELIVQNCLLIFKRTATQELAEQARRRDVAVGDGLEVLQKLTQTVRLRCTPRSSLALVPEAVRPAA